MRWYPAHSILRRERERERESLDSNLLNPSESKQGFDLTSASECGDRLRESARRPRGDRLFEVGERSFCLTASGLAPREGGVLRGDWLLLGLALRRAGEALRHL